MSDDRYVTAMEYTNAIRNRAKWRYAESYLAHLSEGAQEPRRPPGLSYMAAQAVRMRLEAIWRGEDER